MADLASILESLAAAERPEDICAQFGISMVELIEYASRPEVAEFLEKALAFHSRQRAMRQERHAALALDALMEIGLDDTPPADNLEARHRAIRVRALACVISGGARRHSSGVVRPKGEPRERRWAGCRGLNEVKATMSCANEIAPSWPSPGAAQATAPGTASWPPDAASDHSARSGHGNHVVHGALSDYGDPGRAAEALSRQANEQARAP